VRSKSAWIEVGVMTAITGALVPVVATEGGDSWLFAGAIALVSTVLFGPVAWGLRSQVTTGWQGRLIVSGVPLVVVSFIAVAAYVFARPAYDFELGALLFGMTLSLTFVMLSELLAVPEQLRHLVKG